MAKKKSRYCAGALLINAEEEISSLRWRAVGQCREEISLVLCSQTQKITNYPNPPKNKKALAIAKAFCGS